MALLQIAFDFDSVPEENKPGKKVVAPKPKEPSQKKKVKPEKKKGPRGRKSLKEVAVTADLIDIPEDEILFQKSYYSIGKVAAMFKVNQSQIRLWENEFDVLKPKKNGKGDRMFRPEDIKTLQMIHHLIREKKYTMEGAKEFFKLNKTAEEKAALIEALKKLKFFIHELKASL